MFERFEVVWPLGVEDMISVAEKSIWSEGGPVTSSVVKFAVDSLPERSGFEPPVPRFWWSPGIGATFAGAQRLTRASTAVCDTALSIAISIYVAMGLWRI